QRPPCLHVHTVINIEAVGSTGPELVFQATSAQTVDVYARVLYRRHERHLLVRRTHIRHTDFRQFELYLDVTGLDM
ncbi:hypothetical protein DFH11DRAFT_1470958, partial [Phellopilus nigrolimitatus]